MTPAFLFWRNHWAKLGDLSALLAEADKALRRRMKGNHRLPPLPNISDEQTVAAVAAMRNWADGDPPKDHSSRPILARRIGKILKPIWPAVVWPRWLLLEEAFGDASTSVRRIDPADYVRGAPASTRPRPFFATARRAGWIHAR
jgi:hypothetical protein